MSSWKLIIAGFIAVLLLWWLYPSRSTKTKDGITELVVWGPGKEFSEMEPLLKRFERENPEYKVVIGRAAAKDMVADPQRFLCSVAGGMSPDVIKFDRFAISEWASRGAFENLNKYLEEDDKLTNDLYHIDINSFIQPAIDEVTYKGNVYGIPEGADVRLLYYNKDVLIREGFVDKNGNAKPPKTWEELEEYAKKLTKFDKDGNISRLGFAPSHGDSWLYLYGWQNGGRFMSPDGRRCTLNSPEIVEALEFMTRIYDELGGAKKVYAFQSTFQADELDPFLNGKVVMMINGDWFLKTIATYNPRLNFATVPPPIPAARLAAGHKPTSMLAGWCLSIPSAAKNKEGAWKMIRWLSSLEAGKMKLSEESEKNESQGRVYIPRLGCTTELSEYIFENYILKNPNLSTSLKNSFRNALDILPFSRYRPVTPVGQLLWNEHKSATENSLYHKYPSAQASLDSATKIVQKKLDRVYSPPQGLVIRWKWIVITYLGLLFALLLVVVLWQMLATKGKNYFRKQWHEGLICASPWLIGFAIFTGGPILFSIIISFCHYDILNPAIWVGLKNYKWIFTQDPLFWKSLWNTLYMVIGVPIGIVVSLSIAMLLNQKMKAMAFYRTLFYLPAIVPAVAASILWIWVFNPSHGLLNIALSWAGITGPAWLQDETWSKPSLILMGLWAAGGGMIIWLAGLKGIPDHLYEAAEVDGANMWHKFINITIPMLTPYIFFNIIMGLIGTFQIFSQAYIMTQGGPVNSTLFYAYRLFNNAFRYLQMGEASAMSWVLFVIVFGLTMFQLWLSKKWVHYADE